MFTKTTSFWQVDQWRMYNVYQKTSFLQLDQQRMYNVDTENVQMLRINEMHKKACSLMVGEVRRRRIKRKEILWVGQRPTFRISSIFWFSFFSLCLYHQRIFIPSNPFTNQHPPFSPSRFSCFSYFYLLTCSYFLRTTTLGRVLM